MKLERLRRHFVAVIQKHLPPSAAELRLFDLDGRAGAMLMERRKDIESLSIPAADLPDAPIAADSMDAVVALDAKLGANGLRAALRALRPGGRLIVVDSTGRVDESQPRLLREIGFIRILVEPALDGIGVLRRGEKPHRTDDTRARINAVAGLDSNQLDLAGFRGRYLHLLIQQRPNKPVWKREPGETIRWRAFAIERDGQPFVLAFSSLPRAVAFMQGAVLSGRLMDINKVGKFSRKTARTWTWDALLNPSEEALAGYAFTTLEIDPATAEDPDE